MPSRASLTHAVKVIINSNSNLNLGFLLALGAASNAICVFVYKLSTKVFTVSVMDGLPFHMMMMMMMKLLKFTSVKNSESQCGKENI